MAECHFLLVYDLEKQRLVAREPFEDVDEAVRAYADKETEHLGDPTVEIVLIGADSLETIKHTHASYFDGKISGRSKYLTELAS